MFDNHSSNNDSAAPNLGSGEAPSGGLIPITRNENGEPTISSIQISELVEARHDKVKQSIERLAKRGIITLPPMGEVSNSGAGPKFIAAYFVGKRDSFVVVAQLSPEFTARLVDRWQELEAQLARQKNPGGLKPISEQSNDEIIASFGLLVRVAEEERRIALEEKERGDMYKAGYHEQTDNVITAAVAIQAKDQVIAEQAPAVDFYNRVVADGTTYTLEEAAKLAKIPKRDGKKGYWGRNLLKWQLEIDGYLTNVGKRGNKPMQKYVNDKLFEFGYSEAWMDPMGTVHTTPTTLVTPKGLNMIIHKYDGEGELLQIPKPPRAKKSSTPPPTP